MHPLDNVIWQALGSSQAHLGLRNGNAQKFVREVSLLGAFTEPSVENYGDLATLLGPEERVGLFLDSPPEPPNGWNIVITLPLLQMVCENCGSLQSNENFPIVPLGEADVPDMLALTKLTKPGPFAKRTREMGDYFGIRLSGELVAMAGERLRLPEYTEVSAVCTHPDHLGHGYATALISLVMGRIHTRGEKAFLHSRADNERAIALYEKLGFRKRWLGTYAILSH
jgi:ribosomal protein S18 acetylase RimI-like enzyme